MADLTGGMLFFGELMKALGQGTRENRDREIKEQEKNALEEYKKMATNKLKLELDEMQKRADAAERVRSGQATTHDYLLSGLTKDPIEAMIMAGQGMGGGQQQPQQPPQMNIGMNYEEPTAPQTQVTFPAAVTGTPTMPQIDIGRYMDRKLYGTTTNPNDIVGSDTLAGPNGPMRVPRDRRSYRWDLAQPAYEAPVPIQGTTAGGGGFTQFVRPSQQMGSMGPPAQAIPGNVGLPKPGQPIVFDNQETIDAMFGKGKPQIGGMPGGAIQTKPAERDVILKNEDLGKYINPQTGERPKGQWTENSLLGSGYIKEPEKKLGTEEAAKLGNAVEAINNIPQVMGRMFKDGQLDSTFSKELWAWYKFPETMAKSEAAAYGKIMRQAVEAQVRLESGATVPPEEIKRKIETNMAQLFSSPEAVATGFQMLQNTLSSTVEIADPSGFYRAISKKARKEVNPKKPTLSTKDKQLDKTTAKQILNEAGGNRERAREIARQRGYKF